MQSSLPLSLTSLPQFLPDLLPRALFRAPLLVALAGEQHILGSRLADEQGLFGGKQFLSLLAV